jgi:uncharacterized membrane protein YfcA
VREGRVVWPLAWVVILGTLPGVLVGALLRVTLLSDPDAFEIFVGLVLLYFGVRLHYEVVARRRTEGVGSEAPGGSIVRVAEAYARRVEYGYGGKTYAFDTPAVFALSLVVGVIGGIYSIGGGSIIAPFLVTVFGLPVYTVAGATLIGTFVTSVAGVAFYELLDATGFGAGMAIAPDWLLGLTLGIGGLAGTYAGARLQRHVPEKLIRGVLGALVTLLALRYIL